jgi:soluble lytic murein transglycosylase-like protein
VLQRGLQCAFVSAALAMSVPAAQALEHVTLRNGFSLDCSHHSVVGDRTRLFSGSGESNYQELPSDQIAGIENLPDPPATPSSDVAAAVVANASSNDVHHWMERSGTEHNIDVELLASVIKAESAFNPKAVSRTGAQGLMQLMPGTAKQLGVQDAFRADQNIAGGTAYLDTLLKMYKDNLALALAAYNAGPAAVARYHGMPPYRETRIYVARVMNEFYKRKEALLRSTVASR